MKTQTKKTALQIKIESLNMLNTFSSEKIKELFPILNKYIGKKINVANDKISKPLQADIEKLQYQQKGHTKDKTYFDINFWVTVSKYSLYLNTKICINGGSYDDQSYFCQYTENFYFLGQIKDNVLTEVKDINWLVESGYDLKKDYTEEQISALINEYKELKNKAANVLKQIPNEIIKIEYLNR